LAVMTGWRWWMVGGSLAPDAHTVAHGISLATGCPGQFTTRHTG